jgi:hypothetical protein
VDRPVIVTGPHDKPVASTLRVQAWTPEERTARIWKRLLKWWGASLVAVIVPPHLPWFTIAFLGGPIAAWLASRQQEMVQEQPVACPECGALSVLEEQPASWPMGARCEPCRHVFWINPALPEQRGA